MPTSTKHLERKELHDFSWKEPSVKRVPSFNTIGLNTLVVREVRRFFKVWTQTVAAPSITTCLFMAIFVWALAGPGRAPEGITFAAFLAPGLMVMAVLQNAFQNPSSSILIAKIQGTIVDILMPPLSALELTIGFVVGGILRGVAVGLTLWAVFWLWPDVEVSVIHWWAVLYFSVAAATMMSLVGILTGVWALKFDHAAAINNFIIVPLSLLSGTFYSIDRLPETLQTLSHFNPFFYMIDGFRYGFIGVADSDLQVGVLMTLAINILLGIWAHRVFKIGYKLKA